MSKIRLLVAVVLLLLGVLLIGTGGVGAQVELPEHPAKDLYNPLILRPFHLQMTEANWDTIRYDLSYDIELPALFKEEGESPILVSVRRKSADSFPLNDPTNPQKVSLKIDINEYYDDNGGCVANHGFSGAICVDSWKGIKKLSLENGDDNNVVTEGLSWYLHNLAADEAGLDYTTGLYSWITMDMTLIEREDAEGGSLPDLDFYNGVFISVEQRDKTFLKSHGLWAGSDDTWMYKDDEFDEGPEDENGDPIHSPTWELLNYEPFQDCRNRCDEPVPDFVTALNENINMEGMLTFAAVSAFHLSPDDLFSKSHNYFFVDFGEEIGRKREYIEWDLDSAFGGMDYTADIYNVGKAKGSAYEDLIINDPNDSTFNTQYSEIMQTLLDGPFYSGRFNTDLVAFEQLLGPALAADPYNTLGDSVPGYFASLRSWLGNRIVNVQGQLPNPPTGPSAAFSYSASGRTVNFTDLSSGTIVSWEWDFGDGGTSFLQNPSHTYAVDDTYTVTLIVTDNDGDTDSTMQVVTIFEEPGKPTADFSFNTTGLTAAFSDLSCCDITGWSWNFGDGSSSTVQNPSHTYAAAGTYLVTLTVAKDGVSSDPVTKSVTVTEAGGGITLTAAGFKVKGVHHALLEWSGATTANVDIYRSDAFITTVPATDGSYDDNIERKGGWTYPVYKVCNAGSTTDCGTAVASAP